MAEQFYLIGKLGSSDGFQVKSLKLETTGTRNDDIEYFKGIDNQVVFKREFFIISRKNNRTYHTYVREGLSGERGASSLGFSYVYEDGFNVITKMLDLRNVMKEALEDLLQGNGFAIQSFDDPKVSKALMKIKSFTDKVEAKPLPLPINDIQLSPQNPNDLKNEQIWEMLKKSNYVEISEEIPTALSQKEQNIKTLTSQIQQLGILIQQKDTEIQELKNEKNILMKKNEKLDTQLTNANSNNSVRDRKIRNALKEIENCLSSNAENITSTPPTQKQNMLKKILPFFILILVIMILLSVFLICSGNSKQDETKHKDKIEELKNEISQYKDSCDLLNTQINSINNELNNTIKTYTEDTKPKHKKEEVKKEQKDTNKKQPLQDEIADLNEWKKNKKNCDALTEILREYARDNNKKYDNINTDCKDCKEITPQEKIVLWKKHFKTQVN